MVQRVTSASVTVEAERVAGIGRGLLVLLGVSHEDDRASADRLADKLRALRLFEDADGRMNLDAAAAGGEFLVVSNFTLYGDARRGNRPSFTAAAPPERARELYERVRERLGAQGGVFGARMAVEMVGDGPVTLVVEL